MGLSWLCVLCASLTLLFNLSSATNVSYDGRALIIDGERKVLFSGSIHYPRSTPEMWPDLIRKAKEGGLDSVETYVFWNAHEPKRREYHFEGNLDLIRFLKEIHAAGLYAVLRIGPYVCAEWVYGGLPVWLHQIPGMKMRTDNQLFKDEMHNFTSLIVNMVKQENLLAPQGGPIIMTQIENEYGLVMSDYGDGGKEYLQWCASMAESLNVGVPWIMCQQKDAPQPMINTCNGFYCDDFKPNHPNSPKMWTENWTGWFKTWSKADPHRPAEDLAFSVARFFQTGGTFHNYYMYHGGTNFGRTSGGPYITTTYDYDAPIDEYGNLRQPKWGHLKELHDAMKKMEKILTNGDTANSDLGNGVGVSTYTFNGSSGCFLSNTNTTSDFNVELGGNTFSVPARSVSILPDCKKEAYNTAKVTTQTSYMVKRANQAEKQPEQLRWSWRDEDMRDTLQGKGSVAMAKLEDQLVVTGDSSDYLWYMTWTYVSQQVEMTLRVNSTGHALYAFVNGDLVGSHYAPNGTVNFVFETPVTLKEGKNNISLLSATDGLRNYGAFYDERPTGLAGGPVKLVQNNFTIDLSQYLWSYQVGLKGLERQVYAEEGPGHQFQWHSNGPVMTRKPFVWYKTTFKAPLGSNPVVVDLQGLGKGEAWVNGKSIGRYWVDSAATEGTCGECDYRKSFDANESPCRTGCGEPAQRWYHVPRSFLKESEPDTLVLFEEAGGDPNFVNFQTVTVGSACAVVPEGKTLSLSCQGGRLISSIQFASFGDPQGSCGVISNGSMQDPTFRERSCGSPTAFSIVEEACIGKESCLINVSKEVLGAPRCGNSSNRLAVVAIC